MIFIKLLLPFFIGLGIFFIVGWLTGGKEYGGVERADDERVRFIKRKTITHSWTFMLGFLILSTAYDFLNLSKGSLKNIPFLYEHPSLAYLLILLTSYFVFYFIYSRRFASKEE